MCAIYRLGGEERMKQKQPQTIFEWRKWGEKASKRDLFAMQMIWNEESGVDNQPKRYVVRASKISSYLLNIFERRFGKVR